MPLALYRGDPTKWAEFAPHLRTAFDEAGLTVDLQENGVDPGEVDYLIYAPTGDIDDFAPFTRLKAVLSLWAGVERIRANKTLTAPLTRMVDPGMTAGMVEWVTGHVMRHHLDLDAHITRRQPEWPQIAPPLAEERGVAILGIGALGGACATMLAQIGFRVTGWSRTPKTVDGMACRAGLETLPEVLGAADIVVLLLPATAETENLLNAERLAMMRPGAVLLNPGRGTLIDDAALLAALDRGHLAHATLDVFRQEPLPADHPFWPHPKVTVTPHIASETRPETSARAIAENIRRGEAGLPFLHLFDPARGY
ncbi:MAG: glyoxylate/hydroxypyruvate reductase A [Pseudomonadota bacterium]